MTRHGGCNCGKVRLELTGEPAYVGLCHCLTCRKETGSAFMPFATWKRSHVVVTGVTATWTSKTDERHYCSSCGSSLFANDTSDEIEVRLGALDDGPSGLTPQYEIWTPRREHWLQPLAGAAQFPRDHP